MATTVTTKAKGEAKTEPQVLTNQSLGKVLKDWGSAEDSAKSYFLKAAQMVAKLKLERPVVKATLAQYRGLQGMSLDVTTSRLMKSADPKYARRLQEAIDGDITVREFNEIVAEKEPLAEGEVRPVKGDPEKKLTTKMKKAAEFALTYGKDYKPDIDSAKDFGRLARESYSSVMENFESSEEEETSEYGEDEGEEDAA
jgi:hypothetical protein